MPQASILALCILAVATLPVAAAQVPTSPPPATTAAAPTPSPAAAANASGEAALKAFLAPLAGYPSLQAAAESVLTARAQLHAAYDPVSLQATGGYSRFDNTLVDTDPTTPGVQPLPANGGQISADVTLRPWLFGDTADQANKSRLELQQAQLDYQDTLTALQIQAVQAAYGVQLAQESLASAQQGEQVSRAALAATRLRVQKGAGSERELRNAETGLQQAQGYVADSQGSLAVARATLQSLVGTAAPLDVEALALDVPDGTALSVAKARISAQLAAVAVANATRSVYPVVQAGYTWNLDNENSLGVSIESRTLQPQVSYNFQTPGTVFPQNAINGSFQIGLSMNISPGVIDGLDAAHAQLRAARDGVAAAVKGAAVQKASLDNDLAQAKRALKLAQRKVEDATKTLHEDQSRQALGITTPLSTQQAALDLTQTQMDLQQARQDVLAMTLAYYRFYATPLVSQPVSEVRP
ncbi:MAG: TolC family protein [Deinococcales bacterium]